jgi:organic radical activating enzyme
MKIIEVKQQWPSDRLRIEIMIGNTCNFKCWYCFPGSNEGTHRWPEYESFVKHLDHLLTYYETNLGKSAFELHIIGGEPTLWPEFGKFIQYFKNTHNCIFSMSSNGSRTLRWWKEYGSYMDKVILSCHHEQVDVDHFIQVADCLYEQQVIVTGIVLMDPFKWDRCIQLAEELKHSKHQWAIDMQEVYHDTISYTSEQQNILKNNRVRHHNHQWALANNKHIILKTEVVSEDGTVIPVGNNEIVLKKMNNFYGWDCNLGIDSIFIDNFGNITGACRNNLYNLGFQYNIKDDNFIEQFNPKLTTTTCANISCWCQPESNLIKKTL